MLSRRQFLSKEWFPLQSKYCRLSGVAKIPALSCKDPQSLPASSPREASHFLGRSRVGNAQVRTIHDRAFAPMIPRDQFGADNSQSKHRSVLRLPRFDVELAKVGVES